MAVGEVGSATSQRLLLPRDLCLPWVVARRAWKSHWHLSVVGRALPALSCPACLGWRGLGPACQGPGSKVQLTVMGSAWGGRPRRAPAPRQASSKAEQAFRQCVSSWLWVGLPVPAWDLHCTPLPRLPLAPAAGMGPWAQESSAFIPVLNSYRSHLETFFTLFGLCLLDSV